MECWSSEDDGGYARHENDVHELVCRPDGGFHGASSRDHEEMYVA